MTKRILLLVAVLGLPASAVAQLPVAQVPSIAMTSGSFTATSQSTVLTLTNAYSVWGVQVTGTWSGSVDFSLSLDQTCSTYVSAQLVTGGTGALVTSTAANGAFSGSTQLARCLKVASSGTWSGTAVVTIRAGFGVISSNTVQGITSGTAVPVSGSVDVGSPTVTIDAMNQDQQVGSIPSSALAGPVGVGIYRSALGAAATTGAIVEPRFSAYGDQRMVIRDHAGNDRGANVDASGNLSATLPTTQVAVGIEDNAETAGGNLAMAGTVRRDAPATSAGSSGDNATANTNAYGALWVSSIDPCSSEAKTTTPISITTDTVIIPAASSKKNYICSIVIVSGAAEIVSLTEGTGSLCATNEAALIGSTTDSEGMSFAANAGVSAVGGDATILAGKTANVDTCLNVSGSNRVSGFVTWVQR